MSSTSPELDSDTILSTELSTVLTTPEGSLNGGTDKLDSNSSGAQGIEDVIDPDDTIIARPVQSICCVGAGYVGECIVSAARTRAPSVARSMTDFQ